MLPIVFEAELALDGGSGGGFPLDRRASPQIHIRWRWMDDTVQSGVGIVHVVPLGQCAGPLRLQHLAVVENAFHLVLGRLGCGGKEGNDGLLVEC